MNDLVPSRKLYLALILLALAGFCALAFGGFIKPTVGKVQTFDDSVPSGLVRFDEILLPIDGTPDAIFIIDFKRDLTSTPFLRIHVPVKGDTAFCVPFVSIRKTTNSPVATAAGQPPEIND